MSKLEVLVLAVVSYVWTVLCVWFFGVVVFSLDFFVNQSVWYSGLSIWLVAIFWYILNVTLEKIFGGKK